MPVQIIFTEENAIVKKAVDQSNDLFASEDFYNIIRQKDKFDLSTATPQQVANILKASSLAFTVELFYPNFLTFRYRKTLAYTDSRYPNRLFLNFKKLNRSSESIAATVIHESIHAVDDSEEQYTFGHGNNSPVGKDNTAPYWIGNLAYKLLTGSSELIVFDQDENEETMV